MTERTMTPSASTHRRRRRRAVVVAMALTATGALGSPGTAGAEGAEQPGSTRPARSIAAGGDHTCALFDDGRVSCWGRGSSGQLGLGSDADRGDGPGEMGTNLPVIDLGPGRRARAVAAGEDHTCALLESAQIVCWGSGLYGQLGLGNDSDRGREPGQMGSNLPVVDLGVGRTALMIAAGNDHTCAVLDTRQVACWGRGGDGRLGIGSEENIGDEPGEMGAALATVDLGSGRHAVSISAGGAHTCAVLDTRAVKCWGFNEDGQLGQETDDDIGDAPGEMGDALPPVDLGTGRRIRAISSGEHHNCVVLDAGSVKCWGKGNGGQLGLGAFVDVGGDPGDMGDALVPVDLGTGRTARGISAGRLHTCALLVTEQVVCWGHGADGALGNGSPDLVGGAGQMGDALTVVTLGTDRSALAVTTGGDHTCVVRDDGHVTCWGLNASGQLGQGDTSNKGDAPGELGDALAPVDLRRTVGTGTQRPDLKVRSATGPFVGNDVHNLSGRRQTASLIVRPGRTGVFTVRVQNDGNEPDTFAVRGTPSDARFRIVYRRGSNTITGRVTNGTFVTPRLRPGGFVDLTVRIEPRRTAAAGDTVTARVVATSRTDTTERDVVRARVTRR